MGKKALEVKRRLEAEQRAKLERLDGEAVHLLESGLGAIGEARAQIPRLGWQLAGVVRERVDPTAGIVERTAVEKADAVLALFEPSGEPSPNDDVLAIARAQAELETMVNALLERRRQLP